MAGALPPTLQALQNDPRFIITKQDGKTVAQTRPETFLQTEDRNTRIPKTFVAQRYVFDERGRILEGERKRVLRSSTASSSQQQRRAEVVERFTRLESGEVQRQDFDIIASRKGRQRTVKGDTVLFNEDLTASETSVQRTNLTQTQRRNLGEEIVGSQERVARSRAADKERADLNKALRSVGANTVTKREFEALGRSGRADVARQIQNIRTERRVSKARLKSEGPAERAVALKASQQFVKGSAGFDELRAMRLREELEKVEVDTRTTVALGGSEFTATVEVPQASRVSQSISTGDFGPSFNQQIPGTTRTDLGQLQLISLGPEQSIYEPDEVQKAAFARTEFKSQGDNLNVWQSTITLNKERSLQLLEQSIGDWKATARNALFVGITTAGETAFAISPLGVGASLKRGGLKGLVQDYHPAGFAEDLLQGRVIRSRNVPGVVAETAGLVIGFRTGARATKVTVDRFAKETARFNKKIFDEQLRVNERMNLGERFYKERFEAVGFTVDTVRSTFKEPRFITVDGATQFNPRFTNRFRTSRLEITEVTTVDVVPKLTALDRTGRVRGIQTQLPGARAARIPKAVPKEKVGQQTKLTDFSTVENRFLARPNPGGQFFSVRNNQVVFNPRFRGEPRVRVDKVTITEKIRNPITERARTRLAKLAEVDRVKSGELQTSLPARFQGKQLRLNTQRFGRLSGVDRASQSFLSEPRQPRLPSLNKKAQVRLAPLEQVFKRQERFSRKSPLGENKGRIKPDRVGKLRIYEELALAGGLARKLDTAPILKAVKINDLKDANITDLQGKQISAITEGKGARITDFSISDYRSDVRRRSISIPDVKIGALPDLDLPRTPGGGLPRTPDESSKKRPPKRRRKREKGIMRKDVQGYDVLVKEKGQYIKVNDTPLPEIAAFNLGARVTDETTAASFKIRKKGRAKRPYDDVAVAKRAKFIDKGDRWVEKNTHRIDSPGEFAGITVKGWLARRRRLKL